MAYEVGDLSGFKMHLFIGQLFVVPSLNVVTKNQPRVYSLFNLMLRHRKVMSQHIF